MIIDCDSCRARPRACGDCVVSHLLATTAVGPPVDLDDGALAAVGTLAAAGLVPPLRLVPPATPGTAAGSDPAPSPAGVPSPTVTAASRSGDHTPRTRHHKGRNRDIA